MSEDTNASAVDASISSCVRSVIAAILLENHVEDIDDGVCMSILEQIMLKNIMKHGTLTQSFAEHATRSQAHFSDAIMAIAFTGVDIPRLATYAKDYKYPKILEGVKLAPDQINTNSGSVVFQSGDQRRLPRYIPDYFPPMPSVYTFEATPVQKQRKAEYKQAREKLAVERSQVEKGLVTYHLRVVGNFDSPFQLSDAGFSLLPSCYGLEEPAYISALVPSKFEDRRTEEALRAAVKDHDSEKRREDEEMTSVKDAVEGPARKYRRHGLKKQPGEKRATGKTGGRKAGHRSQRAKDEPDESNSTSGVLSPGPG